MLQRFDTHGDSPSCKAKPTENAHRVYFQAAACSPSWSYKVCVAALLAAEDIAQAPETLGATGMSTV